MRPPFEQLAALPVLLVCCLCLPVSAPTCGNGTSLVAETDSCSCGTNASGKVYLAGVFDKRAGSKDEYAWWSEHHFALAINLINNKTDEMWDGILTDTTVEAVSADSACDEDRAAAAYWGIRGWGQPLHGIIGCRCSGASMAVARVAQLEQIPQMSFSSTSPRLSDKQKFPYFFRTVPMQEVDALIMLLRSFGWTRVTMFTTDTVWASDVSAEFERMWLGQHNSPDGEWTGQIAYKHTITVSGGAVDSASVQLALDTVPIDSPELNSRVIVLVCHTEHALPILQHAAAANFQPDSIWVGLPSWPGMSMSVTGWTNPPPIPGYLGLVPFQNTEASGPHAAYLEHLRNYEASQGLGPPFSTEISGFGAETVDAVVAMATALDTLPHAQRGNGSLVRAALRQVHFVGVSGNVSFDTNGDRRDPQFTVVNLLNTSNSSDGAWQWRSVGTVSAARASVATQEICWAVKGCNQLSPPSDRYPAVEVIVIGAAYRIIDSDLNLQEREERKSTETALQAINDMPGFFSRPTRLELRVVDIAGVRAAPDGSTQRYMASQQVAQQLQDVGAIASVGSRYSSDSMALTGPMHDRGIVLVSHSATNSELSDRQAYPSFVRLCPPDSQQAAAMIDVIVNIGWRKVTVIHCDDAYCVGLKDNLVHGLQKAFNGSVTPDIISVTETDDKSFTQATTDGVTRDLTDKYEEHCGDSDVVVVLLLHIAAAYTVLESAGVSTLPVAFLASESVGAGAALGSALAFNGSLLTFTPAVERLPSNHDEAALLPANASDYATMAYDAVRALAEAFAYLQRQGVSDYARADVLAALDTITFRGQSGPVDIAGGDRLLGYKLLDFQTSADGQASSSYRTVGRWSKSGDGTGSLVWDRPIARDSLVTVPACATEEEEDDWFIVVIVLIAVFVGVVAIVLMANKRKEMMKKKREAEKMLLQDDGGLYYQCDRIIYSSESILVVELDRVEWSLAATAYTRVANTGSEDKLALTFLRDERRYHRKLRAQQAIDNSVAAVDIPPPGEKNSGNAARNDKNRAKLPNVVDRIIGGETNWYKTKVIVMSCPEKGTLSPDGSGPYKEPVMTKINELRQQGRLHVGFDRAGSSNIDSRDADTWPKVFKTENQEHLFVEDEEKRKELVKSTYWFTGYQSAAKAQMKLECHNFYGTLEVICIKGGTITNVEHEEMDRIIEGAKRDAAMNGIRHTDIQLKKMSYCDFLRDYADAEKTAESRCPFTCAFSTQMARHTLLRELELKPWVPGGDKALVQYYLRRIAERLQSMHEARWTHGDVSLENVLVFAQSSSRAASQADGTLTRTPTAAERLELKLSGLSRAKDHHDDAETQQACQAEDIRRFGMVARQMCTKKGLDLPFDTNANDNISSKTVEVDSETRVEWPEAEELVLWCLCKDLLPRPQSFEEVLGHPFLRADDDDCDEIKRRKLENVQLSKMAIAEGVPQET